MSNQPKPEGADDPFEIIWHDPPPTGRWGPRLERFTAQLADKPDTWGELPLLNGEGYPSSVVITLKRSYADKGFEFRTTVFEAGNHNKVRIFGRKVSEFDPDDAARRSLRPVRP